MPEKGCPPSGAQTSKPCDLLGWTWDPLALQNIWSRAPHLRQGSKQHAALPRGNSGRQGSC
jgi:hypothetical protein